LLDALDIHRLYARNNAWCNARLHAACAELSETAYKAARGAGFFKSIHGVLSHILIVDWFYLDALFAERHGRLLRRLDEPFDTLAEVSEAQRAADLRLVQFCDGIKHEHLEQVVYLERPHGVNEDTVAQTLLHLFQHDIHHRGQAHALLTDAGADPPQLDEFFLTEDRAQRDAELAELGIGPPRGL
jgi:uncharacterized damage-inducible protein DinB